MIAPVRSLQRRADGLVVGRGPRSGATPVRPGSRSTRPTTTRWPAWPARHRGMVLSGLRLVVNPARRPVGLTATLRAPLRAAEPALSWAPGGPAHPHGRLAQR